MAHKAYYPQDGESGHIYFASVQYPKVFNNPKN